MSQAYNRSGEGGGQRGGQGGNYNRECDGAGVGSKGGGHSIEVSFCYA